MEPVTLVFLDAGRRAPPAAFETAESVAAKSRPLPPLTPKVPLITRCRRSPANILITAQYINYRPCNHAGTRRGISTRSVCARSRQVRRSSSFFDRPPPFRCPFSLCFWLSSPYSRLRCLDSQQDARSEQFEAVGGEGCGTDHGDR